MRNRLAVALLVPIAAGLVTACAARRVQPPEGRGDATLIMLLPDPEGNTIGRARVSSPRGSTDLDDPREFTLVGVRQPPTRVRVMDEADLNRLFGDVIAALPPAPAQFTLFFRFESDELTDEGRALVPEVLRAMKNRPVPEVAVVGHTDTKGSATRNYKLGMKRATMVRGLLLDAGLEASALEVTSHGESVPLVRTPDETYEPRNRRVDITIR